MMIRASASASESDIWIFAIPISSVGPSISSVTFEIEDFDIEDFDIEYPFDIDVL
jgi:hypothetical protein